MTFTFNSQLTVFPNSQSHFFTHLQLLPQAKLSIRLVSSSGTGGGGVKKSWLCITSCKQFKYQSDDYFTGLQPRACFMYKFYIWYFFSFFDYFIKRTTATADNNNYGSPQLEYIYVFLCQLIAMPPTA